MTDSMNFGPEWLRNLSSDGSTGGGTGGIRYQLAEYRYGREDMLALFDKSLRPPNSLCSFSTLYSEQPLLPLAFQTSSEDERVWQTRAPPVGVVRGRGGSLERGGRTSRGRGTYQPYGRSGGFESGGGWGNSEQADWSPRKDYNRSSSVDNWRRNRGDEDEGWRSNTTRISEKWGRQTSWRDGEGEERGPQDRTRNWLEGPRSNLQRRGLDDELPEWATENTGEGGGTFDASGAFHGSDDEIMEHKIAEADKKESPLQKSSSQQNVMQKKHPAILPSSKSSLSLSKPPEDKHRESDTPPDMPPKRENDVLSLDGKESKEAQFEMEKHEAILKEKMVDPYITGDSNGISHEMSHMHHHNRVDEDFDRLQEDLVLKIVEEPSKSLHVNNSSQIEVGMSAQPPPNLAPPVQDKWYYQDPQGDLQGPFSSSEMAEWFRAGYFTINLLVRRQCDERFYMLGDLVTLCNGNPFQTNMRIAPLKNENPNDLIKMQLMQQLALRQQQVSPRVYPQGEPWSNLSALQQREMVAQQLMTQPQMPPDMQYMPPQNPLLQMFQMNQTNKPIPEKPQNPLPVPIDPIQALVQQMGGLQSLQSRLPGNVGMPGNPAAIPPTSILPGKNVLPVPNNANLSANTPMTGIGLPNNLQNDTMPPTLPGLHNPIPPNNLPIPNLPNLPGGLAGNMPNSLPSKPPHTNVDPINDNNPINNLLRQFANKSQPQQQRDAMWQQNQFVSSQMNSQWPQKQPPAQDVPISMWDMPIPSLESNLPAPTTTPTSEETIKQKEAKNREGKDNKDEKKKKELEEKAAKKESEEKKKLEQKKLEAEKKAAEEKRKRDEERIRKELEKAKKEAEEKRLRELEEKRKLKEQRKAEEEARKKAEELKKVEDLERRETRDKEEVSKKQLEATKQENQIKLTKAAPWCQSNNTHGASLADIQKAEREKRAEQAALLQKVKLEQEAAVPEKPFNSQFSWAKKPMAPRQVKSLAEIQAEEQEKLAKQVAEARLAHQQKEKESVSTINQGIWNGQNLTWANNASQWSTSAGFWDGTISEKVSNKTSSVQKSNSASTTSANQQPKPSQKQPPKTKVKKEQEVVKTLNNNNSVNDEFVNWCTKSLTALNTSVDIPTFVNFLRDIESALDVRDYCRDYLGDSPATYQFASQFLEKRRSFKPKMNAHKDDMCSPAPAITPSSHSDFQEVKTKGKKTKKSKMLKVDARILGFNVTASHDRINVGDRDYVDN